MRNHGWQPPFHPLQTVAIAVFCTLAFSFYVFFAPFLGTRTLKFVIIGCFTPLVVAVCFLYVACTWIDPADPGVYRSQEHYSPKKEAETGPSREGDAGEGGDGEEPKKSLQSQLEIREEGHERTGCKPLERCQGQQREPADVHPDEELLYCSICDADISVHSKHCRACDKCVHGFDHHCRWLNNCVGTRNYKLFVALMVSCLLMLILEWAVGIVVMVRCFRDQASFDQEISDKLGRSFPRVAFITVLLILAFLAFVATAPLTQLFCFHLILMHKGITTYDYILAVRDEKEFWEGNGGTSSSTTSPATSTETGFSGYNSAASKRIVFCTPPRMFVDQDQTVMALSDLEVGAGKAGAGKIIDSAKSRQKPGVPGLNPWKLARVTTEDATRAAARARAKSSILHPNRPGGTEPVASAGVTLDTDSNGSLHSSSAGEIRLASRSGRFRKPAQLPRPTWSHPKKYQVSPEVSSDTPGTLSLRSSVDSGLPALPLEPRSPYRSSRGPNDAFSGDPRASFPVPQGPYPAHILFPRFPGDPGGLLGHGQVDSSVEGAVRRSVTSDGYEASCGESGDETSEAVGLSPAWNQPTWSKDPYKEEDVKPWVAAFPGTGSSKPDVVGSPAGQPVSSGSRVEANILKAKPELRHARMQSSSPTVYEESPLRESSDFLSEETTTSYGEPQDRSTMTSFFYTGPESESFKATSERQGVSNLMPVNRFALSRGDPKLLVDTP